MSILYNPALIADPVELKGGVDERGLVTLDATWLRDTLDDALTYPPRQWQGLDRRGISIQRNKGGGYLTTGSYHGPSPDLPQREQNSESPATYELDTTQASKPVTVHPNIKALKESFGWAQLDDGTYGFPERMPGAGTTGQGPGGARLSLRDGVSPLYGVTEWLDVGAVWRKRYLSTSQTIPSGALRNLGRIDIPEGPAPQAGEGRNWLRAAVRAAGIPGAWEITIEWHLSGRGGWEPALYRGSR